jgi:c-di-GMP-related signal transduction protein
MVYNSKEYNKKYYLEHKEEFREYARKYKDDEEFIDFVDIIEFNFDNIKPEKGSAAEEMMKMIQRQRCLKNE